MTAGIFSTYRQGENRITSTFLAVLQRLSVDKIERILGALQEDDSFQLIRFDNQVRGNRSVPDAFIGSNFGIWIETKTSPGSLNEDQVRRHLESVKDGQNLLLLTPDKDQPPATLSFPGVRWSNFDSLSAALRDVLNDPDDPPTEREAFLLREFLILLKSDGLIEAAQDLVLVVAAGQALNDYKNTFAYVCQPNRSFRKVGHLAFYSNKRIHRIIPAVLDSIEEVTLTGDGIAVVDGRSQARLKTLLPLLEQFAPHQIGTVRKVMFLSKPIDDETLTLAADVVHERPGAFVQGHRYVPFYSLKASPRTTSEFISDL